MKHLVFLMSFLFSYTSFADFPVQAKLTSYYDLVNDEALLQKYLLATYGPDETFLFKSSSPKLLKELDNQRCVGTSSKGIEIVFSNKCLNLLPPTEKTSVLRLAASEYDKVVPSYQLIISETDRDLLNQYKYIKYIHQSLNFQGTVDAQIILPPKVAQTLWTSSLRDGDANCLGTTLSTISLDRAPTNEWPPQSVYQYFKKLGPQDNLQVGDIFEFIIPGDGHFFNYIGTDSVSGEQMVFTKNGRAPSPFQFMRYKDVYELYAPYNIRRVNRYRGLSVSESALLYLSNDVIEYRPEQQPSAPQRIVSPFQDYLKRKRSLK